MLTFKFSINRYVSNLFVSLTYISPVGEFATIPDQFYICCSFYRISASFFRQVTYRRLLVLFFFFFLIPGRGQNGPMKQRSTVRLSFRLSVRFLGIGLVFSETQHVIRGPYIVVCDRTAFSGKNPHRAKIVKNDTKTGFLPFLRKLRHQFCLKLV